MAEVGLVKFAKVAMQLTETVMPRYRTKFSKHTFTQPQRVAILCLMRYEDWTFREVEVRLAEHRELREALGLRQVVDYTTLYRFLRRFDEGLWRGAWRRWWRGWLPLAVIRGTRPLPWMQRDWPLGPSAPSSSNDGKSSVTRAPDDTGSSGRWLWTSPVGSFLPRPPGKDHVTTHHPTTLCPWTPASLASRHIRKQRFALLPRRIRQKLFS